MTISMRRRRALIKRVGWQRYRQAELPRILRELSGPSISLQDLFELSFPRLSS